MKEIILPDDYTGKLEQENKIIENINSNFSEIEESINLLPDKSTQFEKYVVDFEDYEIDLYFSENKTKATLSIKNENIFIKINDKTIEIDADGNII